MGGKAAIFFFFLWNKPNIQFTYKALELEHLSKLHGRHKSGSDFFKNFFFCISQEINRNVGAFCCF